MTKLFEFDCGCGLPTRIKMGTLMLDRKLKEQFSEGWGSTYFSPSKARKCRTCGEKKTHGFTRYIGRPKEVGESQGD